MPAGQNFLIDKNIALKFTSLIPENFPVFEIGAGKGALTNYLLEKSRKVVVIEKDPYLADFLKNRFASYKNFEVVEGNVLKLTPEFKEPFYIIGNLPYQISTEIIFWLAKVKNFIQAFLSFQKETAERFLSKEGSPLYGRTSLTVGVFFKAEKLLDISRTCFKPSPKISSTVVSFKRKNIDIDVEKWREFLNLCFFSKRKVLISNLKRAGFDAENFFKQNNLPKNLRPHQASPEIFLKLFDMVHPVLSEIGRSEGQIFLMKNLG